MKGNRWLWKYCITTTYQEGTQRESERMKILEGTKSSMRKKNYFSSFLNSPLVVRKHLLARQTMLRKEFFMQENHVCVGMFGSFELLQLIMKYCLFIELNKSYQINKSICSIRWAGGMFNCVILFLSACIFVGVDVIIFFYVVVVH